MIEKLIVNFEGEAETVLNEYFEWYFKD